MRAISKVDSKGRITIPMFIREELNIEPDSYVEMEYSREDRALVIRPLTRAGELLVDIHVELSDVDQLQRALSTIINEGSEIRMLRCVLANDRYGCVITAVVIDFTIANAIRESLVGSGVNVTRLAPVTRKVG